MDANPESRALRHLHPGIHDKASLCRMVTLQHLIAAEEVFRLYIDLPNCLHTEHPRPSLLRPSDTQTPNAANSKIQ